MKKRFWRKALSTLLALTMCLSLPLSVLAEEGFVDVETTAGNKESVKVNIDITPTTQPDGSVQTETKTEANNQVTDSGKKVSYQGESNMTEQPDGTVTGTASDSYTVSSPGGTYKATGGSETEIVEQAPDASVDVPLTDEEGKNQNTGYGDPAGTVTGDKPAPGAGSYDSTYTEVLEQGSITATTDKVEFTETSNTDMNYVEGTVTGDGKNNLVDINDVMDKEDATLTDGYTHVYIGSDVLSQYVGAFVCKEPASPNEKPAFVKDGVPYYVKSNPDSAIKAGFSVDGYYFDGEYVDQQTAARWSYIQRFLFIDAQSGEVFTTYCVDQQTDAVDGYSYIMQNVEDADYYSEESAAKIRAVALNGYWGTESGKGSLSAMKDTLKASGQFTQKELDALTDGIAMTATQYAIWTYSNQENGDKFISAYFKNENGSITRVPDGQESNIDLIFKVYNYLTSLEAENTKGDTSDTLINQDNFLEDLSVKVIKKAEDHDNNKDDDKSNDAYTTNITFALKVTPSGKNGEEMVVELVGNGVSVKGRITGQLQEGEIQLKEENGNYTFENIIITEGDQTFSINLSGIQHLEQGVYLYSSEVRNETTSQTMIGIASGERSYDVSMDIEFSLDVKDEVVAKEHVWRSEKKRPNTFRLRQDPEGGDGLTEIDDEDVPLADAPETGDASIILAAISALSGIGYAGLNFGTKRKER